ncbi:hypothetical protein GH714_039671 [Hevea brasiliensis]|uniref:BHLH domain-containing protein n=1 Tax=Hevea brasiliensis TaxID=3981 RepID=A0A6A6MZW3_HEVBR|nr:hypothetical protein GH714_039671 [Hevea brasiliensis]
MNSGLTRYQSAPGSYFCGFLDRELCEELLNRPTSPETERIFARFLANSGGKTENMSNQNFGVIKQDSPVREAVAQVNQQAQLMASVNNNDARLHQQQHQQQLLRQQSNYSSSSRSFYQNQSRPPLPDKNSGSGVDYRMVGMERLPQMKSYAVLRGMGDFGAGNRETSYSAASRPPPHSSGRMSPIAEIGNKNIGKIALRIVVLVKLAATIMSQSGDSRNHPPMLAHHLSLPKTSAEISAIEKFLQLHDSVPCKIRAKRGCATHPRSIAERVRRTRISERMRKLQDLVPNMDKQTNTADMLDLAVDYIKDLQRQVEDQVLSRMQQKLDDLCEQVSSIKNHAGVEANASLNKNVKSPSSDAFGCNNIKFVDCGCWHCDHHQNLFAGFMGNSDVKISRGDEVLQYKMPLLNDVEQEERRMSDLSDWASSVTSTADIQMNTSGIDQDIFNLKRECDEKDATIKELISTLQSTNMAGSKRTAELEDIIRRKNTMISKLRKDLMVLEQKLVQLTRLRRTSSSLPISDSWEVPFMLDNIVYDMDNSTSPSSSDSDSSPGNRAQASVIKNQVTSIYHSANSPPQPASVSSHLNQQQADIVPIQETPLQSSDLAPATKQTSAPSKTLSSLARLNEPQTKSRPVCPLTEISMNQKSSKLSSLRPKQFSTSGEFKKIRRRIQTTSTDATPKKRWV